MIVESDQNIVFSMVSLRNAWEIEVYNFDSNKEAHSSRRGIDSVFTGATLDFEHTN